MFKDGAGSGEPFGIRLGIKRINVGVETGGDFGGTGQPARYAVHPSGDGKQILLVPLTGARDQHGESRGSGGIAEDKGRSKVEVPLKP